MKRALWEICRHKVAKRAAKYLCIVLPSSGAEIRPGDTSKPVAAARRGCSTYSWYVTPAIKETEKVSEREKSMHFFGYDIFCKEGRYIFCWFLKGARCGTNVHHVSYAAPKSVTIFSNLRTGTRYFLGQSFCVLYFAICSPSFFSPSPP